MSQKKYSKRIEITQEAISFRKFFKTRKIQWGNIVSLQAMQMDKLTYFQNFLIVRDTHKQGISVGELECDFDSLQAIICEKFDVCQDWRLELEKSGPGTWITLFNIETD